jgi:Na+-transporting NADH:ubiquinone oxidoreductase subunit NqrD
MMLKTVVLPMIRRYIPNTIRHVAQVAAGSLMTVGVIEASQQELVTGALVAAVAGLWSLLEKKGLVDKLFA